MFFALKEERTRVLMYRVCALLIVFITMLTSLNVIPVTFTHAQSSFSKPLLGINSGADRDLFTDAMKTARITWDNQGDGDVPLDANGWPTTDGGVYVWESKDKNEGTYKLIFTGQADVDVWFGYATVTNKQYDTSTNTTTADVIVTDSSSQNFHLNFRNSRRTLTSNTNSGVTNVRLYKPISRGSSTPYNPGQTFTSDYKNAVAPYSYVRFMGGTNWNTSKTWSDRTTVFSSTQHEVLLGEEPFEGNQIAFEYMVQFCNETNKDLFVLVPAQVDDAYITKLAQLIKYGSDGLNPYTEPTANPVYAPLKSTLNVYVEYTNEAWNFMFNQATYVYQSGKAETQSNPASPLNYDNINDENVWRFRYYARRAKEMSDLFRGVFGNSEMRTRVRPLLFWQYNNLSFTAEHQLEFLNNYYNNADGIQHVSDPHPPSYFFWGGGGAVYYHSKNDNAGSVDGIYNAGFPEDGNISVTNTESYWAQLYGLHYVAYEGGYAVGGDTPNDIQKQAKFDPRAKQTMINSYQAFARAGGSAYTVGTYGQWQSAVVAQESPLVQAAEEISSSGFSVDPIMLGTALSTTSATIIAGPHYTVARTWPTGATSSVGKVAGYLIRTESAGTYQITLNLSNAAAGGKFHVYVDGVLLATVTVPSGSQQNVVVGSTVLGTGLHGILLRPTQNVSSANAGTVNALIVQPGTGIVPPNLPALGNLPSGWQHQDIGPIGQSGTASYNNGTFSVTASGYDITGNADAFHFAYQTVSGNGSIVAQITHVSNSYEYAKPGLMIRESIDTGAKHASTFLFPSLLGAFNARTTTGGDSIQGTNLPSIDLPYWVKLERQGNTFTGYVSQSGSNWVQVGSTTIDMSNTVLVGLAFSPHDTNLLGSADFEHVSLLGFTGVVVTPTATPNVTPTPTATPPVGSVTLSNKGFETPDVGADTFSAFQYNPSNASWSFGGESGIAGNNGGFTYSNPAAPEGKQVGFLQRTGTISQEVTFGAGRYTITFAAAQRSWVNTGQHNFQILIDNQVLETYIPPNGNYSTHTTASFVVTAGMHTIQLKGVNSVGGDNSSLIDNIVVTAVS